MQTRRRERASAITGSIEFGTIEVFFDALSRPIMKATKRTFTSGRAVVGSSDDTGRFTEICLRGVAAGRAQRL